MIAIAFFFLLRPGEYTGTTSDDAAFKLADVSLFVNDTRLNFRTATTAQIQSATSVSYTFTTQKNARRNEVILHGRSGDRLCCPVKASIRRVLYHKLHHTVDSAPIASYYNARTNRRTAIKAKDVTDVLRQAAVINRVHTGINPKDITARSLRAGGAMALLCGRVDHNLIQMLGRWHSDAMMRYLHLQAKPVMQGFAAKMYNHGTYSFLPTETVSMAT